MLAENNTLLKHIKGVVQKLSQVREGDDGLQSPDAKRRKKAKIAKSRSEHNHIPHAITIRLGKCIQIKIIADPLMRLKGEKVQKVTDVYYTTGAPIEAMSFGTTIIASWGTEGAGVIETYLPKEKKGVCFHISI